MNVVVLGVDFDGLSHVERAIPFLPRCDLKITIVNAFQWMIGSTISYDFSRYFSYRVIPFFT